jgi:alpha-tubulin suppressor-like RCC1 family protein
VLIDTPIDQLAAGEYCFIARGADGSVWTWGHNLFGQIGNGGTGNHPRPYKVTLPNNETARLVGASYEGAFVVTNQGNIYAWGRNVSGSLGIPSSGVNRSPKRTIESLNSYANRITHIAGGYRFGQALLDNGTVIGWGQNDRIGLSGSSNTTTPVVINIPLDTNEKVEQMHARFIGTIVRTDKNRVFTWGNGANGFGIYSGNNNSVLLRPSPAGGEIMDIGGGKEHVYYVTSNGRVWGAGYGAARKLSLSSSSNRPWPGVVVDLP